MHPTKLLSVLVLGFSSFQSLVHASNSKKGNEISGNKPIPKTTSRSNDRECKKKDTVRRLYDDSGNEIFMPVVTEFDIKEKESSRDLCITESASMNLNNRDEVEWMEITQKHRNGNFPSKRYLALHDKYPNANYFPLKIKQRNSDNSSYFHEKYDSDYEYAECQKDPQNYMARIMKRYREDLGINNVKDFDPSAAEVLKFLECFKDFNSSSLREGEFQRLFEAYSFLQYIGIIPEKTEKCEEIKEKTGLTTVKDLLTVYEKKLEQFTVINWDLIDYTRFKSHKFYPFEKLIKNFDLKGKERMNTHEDSMVLSGYGKEAFEKYADSIRFHNPDTIEGRRMLLYQRIYRRYLEVLAKRANPFYIDWKSCYVSNWPASISLSDMSTWTDEDIETLSSLIDRNELIFYELSIEMENPPAPLGLTADFNPDSVITVEKITGKPKESVSDDERICGTDAYIKKAKALLGAKEPEKQQGKSSHEEEATDKVNYLKSASSESKSSKSISKSPKSVSSNGIKIVQVKIDSKDPANPQKRQALLDRILEMFRTQTDKKDATEVDWKLAQVFLLQNHLLPFSTDFRTVGDIETFENLIKENAFKFLNLSTVPCRSIRVYERLYKLYYEATYGLIKNRGEYEIQWDQVEFTGLPATVGKNLKYPKEWKSAVVKEIEQKLDNNRIVCKLAGKFKKKVKKTLLRKNKVVESESDSGWEESAAEESKNLKSEESKEAHSSNFPELKSSEKQSDSLKKMQVKERKIPEIQSDSDSDFDRFSFAKMKRLTRNIEEDSDQESYDENESDNNEMDQEIQQVAEPEVVVITKKSYDVELPGSGGSVKEVPVESSKSVKADSEEIMNVTENSPLSSVSSKTAYVASGTWVSSNVTASVIANQTPRFMAEIKWTKKLSGSKKRPLAAFAGSDEEAEAEAEDKEDCHKNKVEKKETVTTVQSEKVTPKHVPTGTWVSLPFKPVQETIALIDNPYEVENNENVEEYAQVAVSSVNANLIDENRLILTGEFAGSTVGKVLEHQHSIKESIAAYRKVKESYGERSRHGRLINNIIKCLEMLVENINRYEEETPLKIGTDEINGYLNEFVDALAGLGSSEDIQDHNKFAKLIISTTKFHARLAGATLKTLKKKLSVCITEKLVDKNGMFKFLLMGETRWELDLLDFYIDNEDEKEAIFKKL